jgi:glucose-6-phosphate isomerase
MEEYGILRGLEKAAKRIGKTSLQGLFGKDHRRLRRFGVEAAGLRFDFSRQLLGKKALRHLLAFAETRGVPEFLQAMTAGEIVNGSEGRAAQHMALRAGPGANLSAQGKLVSKEIDQTTNRMKELARQIHSREITGPDGETITHIIHIGIGGSDLGPKMVAKALRRSAATDIELRFVANVDAAEINDALEGLQPAATLVFVVSKTFSTAETLANAKVARRWLHHALGDAGVAAHMYAISARPDRAEAFGLNPAHVFGFADWVGGRFSLWSAVGLSLMVGLGETAWEELLAGAKAMDEHVLRAPMAQNAPALSALISFWNMNFLKFSGRAIIPYASRLALLPLWMQQLVMESNGKSVQTFGSPVQYRAAPNVFGDAGTNAQHAFFQALHQGPVPVPVDFIGVIQDQEENPDQHQTLLANMLGQSSALMLGRRNTDDPHKNFPGNRPSTTILMDALSPFALGALLAFYEHETVILAHLCRINPFDQWGVELGKALAGQIEPRLAGQSEPICDPATEALITEITKRNKD